MRVPPVENPMSKNFKEYDNVPETVPLGFMKYGVMWVVSNLSGATGVMGSEAIELKNWLIHSGCTLEELMVVVAELAKYMANYTPPPPPVLLLCYYGMLPSGSR